MTFSKTSEKAQISVYFDYSESCHNVYKHFTVTINGKNSNIKGLRKYLSKEEPSIITAKTYFWHPDSSASGRRRNETRRMDEVRSYFISEGFEEN